MSAAPKSMGRGQRQVCDTDEFGFRRKKSDGEFNAPRLIKRTRGFQTGDIARVKVPKGNNKGNYIARITIRKTGSFSIKLLDGKKTFKGTYKYCQIVHHTDGYDYELGEAFASA